MTTSPPPSTSSRTIGTLTLRLASPARKSARPQDAAAARARAMAMDGGSWQGAHGEAVGRRLGDRRDGDDLEAEPPRAGRPRGLRDARARRPEHELAQIGRAPEPAVAGRRDRRHGDAGEHHRERYSPEPCALVSRARYRHARAPAFHRALGPTGALGV